ncbi:beta-ketoacyl-[acyl-carrier-protein] synthase family protein [Thermopirellula anaerolimosa]
MDANDQVVITGLGVVSPIGIGGQVFRQSLLEGRSGVQTIPSLCGLAAPAPIGGYLAEFDVADRVRPRKALKVMSRDIQMAFAAADLAVQEACILRSGIEPERLGIVFGTDLIPCELDEIAPAVRSCLVDGEFDFGRWGGRAMSDLYPLWLLKYLPNMPACHIGIALDAQGPNNTLTLGEVSGLCAIAEAVRVIQRGQADVMICGGTGSRIHPAFWARHGAYPTSKRTDDPAAACRPFDADRDGMVHGEGAGAIVLERKRHAEARRAAVYAEIKGFANTSGPTGTGSGLTEAIARAIRSAVEAAGLSIRDIGHVNAHGVGTVADDEIEARAIQRVLGDVPVTAPKSYFGNLAAGAGVVELAVSLLAIRDGSVPPTLNYHRPDPRCPIQVIHDRPLTGAPPAAVVLNHSPTGQAASLVVAAP